MKRNQIIIIGIVFIIIASITMTLNGKQEKIDDCSVNSADSAQEITNTLVPTPTMVLTATPTPKSMETTTPTLAVAPNLSIGEEMTGETETKTAEESNKTAEQETRQEKPQTITTEDGEVIISSGDTESQTDSSEKSQQMNPQQGSGNDFSDGSIELPMIVIGE